MVRLVQSLEAAVESSADQQIRLVQYLEVSLVQFLEAGVESSADQQV